MSRNNRHHTNPFSHRGRDQYELACSRTPPVPVVVKDPGINNLVLSSFLASLSVFLDQIFVGKFLLGVFVEELHIRVCRSVINVEMRLLDALAMIPLRIRKAKKTFLQEVIFLVPEGKSNILQAMGIGDTSNAILSPAKCPRSSMFMGEMTPGITISAVILTNCCPLSLGHVRTPLLPVLRSFSILFQTLLLLAQVLMMVDLDHVDGRLR